MKWSKVKDDEICNKILQIINKGSQRLMNPEQIEKDMIQLMQERRELGIDYIPWSAIDLARGYAGFCVLFGVLDSANPKDGWDSVGHCYLQEIQKILGDEGAPGLGLWTGLPGVIMASRALSRNGERYNNFIKDLNSFFKSSFPSMIKFMKSQLDQGITLNELDVIQGISGIGRYVICFIDDKEMESVLYQILSYLVTLCEEHNVRGVDIPGWFISYDKYMGYDREEYPNGHFNFGLSHGITGVLALMSIAIIKGVEVPGQREAIHKIVQQIMKWKEYDEFGPIWPAKVSWEENLEGRLKRVHCREAWCYGNPGVARAIWLSGIALNNNEWKNDALDTYRGIAKRPMERWNIESSTFCHGLAGLLQMVQRMYSDSGDEVIGDLRNNLLQQILELWDPDQPYGYYEYENSDKQDIPGLLDGAAGVFTVLAGLIQEQDLEWDSVFLIC